MCWMRFHLSLEGELPELLSDRNFLMFELLKPEPAQKLLSDHRSGREDDHKLLFSLVMLEQWLRGTWSSMRPWSYESAISN
jgi:asparagine synthase (glutamine-hydrolysing)